MRFLADPYFHGRNREMQIVNGREGARGRSRKRADVCTSPRATQALLWNTIAPGAQLPTLCDDFGGGIGEGRARPVYTQHIHFVVQQNITHHCKQLYTQLRIN